MTNKGRHKGKAGNDDANVMLDRAVYCYKSCSTLRDIILAEYLR